MWLPCLINNNGIKHLTKLYPKYKTTSDESRYRSHTNYLIKNLALESPQERDYNNVPLTVITGKP